MPTPVFLLLTQFIVLLLVCIYPAAHAQKGKEKSKTTRVKKSSVRAFFDARLGNTVHETSGLVRWNGRLWTHNDSGGQPALYEIDTTTGKVLKTVAITHAENTDWEDLAQDDNYLYIGDFGNNKGSRKDLAIYRVKKQEVENNTTAAAEVIHFSYADQTNFDPARGHHTRFDCEAFIAYGDSLYLFTKDWISNHTRLYRLPKTAGTFVAENTGKLEVNGLITGATIIPDKRVIVLAGYNPFLKPFVYLLYDFSGDRFFDAQKQKVNIRQSLLQVEGICPVNDTHFYVSNESLSVLDKLLHKRAKLHTINLAPRLAPYYQRLSVIAGN